jgi:hypothetical protein
MKEKDCDHGFSSQELCPVCKHFRTILEAEAKERAAARKRKDERELDRMESDGPAE